MIIDVTGTVLTPGNDGKDCLGNGSHYDEFGNLIEICCEQCDYFLCCNAKNNKLNCEVCEDALCPRYTN